MSHITAATADEMPPAGHRLRKIMRRDGLTFVMAGIPLPGRVCEDCGEPADMMLIDVDETKISPPELIDLLRGLADSVERAQAKTN